MPTFLVALLLVVLVAPVTDAQAAPPLAWQKRAIAVAENVWTPSCGPVSVVFADPATSGAAKDDGTPEPGAVGWATPGDCRLYISWSHEWLGYEDFCHVVLHEVGHIAGAQHSGNYRSVMYPFSVVTRGEGYVNGRLAAVQWHGVDKRCLRGTARPDSAADTSTGQIGHRLQSRTPSPM